MPLDNLDPLSILTAAHEARRMAYYLLAGRLETALNLIKASIDPQAEAAESAVIDAKTALYKAHCRDTKQEDDAVRALVRAEASTAAFLESGAPDEG